MSQKPPSASLVSEAAPRVFGELSLVTTAALATVIEDARAELVLAKSNNVDWSKNPARATQWIGVLVPLWRELMSQARQTPIPDNTRIAPADADAALELIEGFSSVLGARMPPVVRDSERHAAIEKAKREGECTADALTAMGGLLSPDGVALPASRGVEKW